VIAACEDAAGTPCPPLTASCRLHQEAGASSRRENGHGTLESAVDGIGPTSRSTAYSCVAVVRRRFKTRDNELAGGDATRKGSDSGRHGGELAPRDPSVKLFGAVADYLKAKEATANSKRTIEFDRERLEIVKRLVGDVKLTAITRKTIEGLQAKRRLEGAGNRTINMDVGALRQVLRRFKQWRRLEDDVKMLTEAGGVPVGRALTVEEQKRLFEAAASNPEWEHVYCAAVLAANTSMRAWR